MQLGPVDPKTRKAHVEFFRVDFAEGFAPMPGAPGLQVRILAGTLDEVAKRGGISRLVRWAPGAHLDEVKVHDFYEEVLVAAGTFLVADPGDRTRFVAFPSPSFATRPPGVPHGPFKAGPEGCLLFETQYYLP